MSAPVPLHLPRKYHGATRGLTSQLRCERLSVNFRDVAQPRCSDILTKFQIQLQIQDMFWASCFKDHYSRMKYTKDIRPTDICFYPVLNKTLLRCIANTKWQSAGRMLSLLQRDGYTHQTIAHQEELCPPVILFASYISKNSSMQEHKL